jgi:hypothetical protein
MPDRIVIDSLRPDAPAEVMEKLRSALEAD